MTKRSGIKILKITPGNVLECVKQFGHTAVVAQIKRKADAEHQKVALKRKSLLDAITGERTVEGAATGRLPPETQSQYCRTLLEQGQPKDQTLPSAFQETSSEYSRLLRAIASAQFPTALEFAQALREEVRRGEEWRTKVSSFGRLWLWLRDAIDRVVLGSYKPIPK